MFTRHPLRLEEAWPWKSPASVLSPVILSDAKVRRFSHSRNSCPGCRRGLSGGIHETAPHGYTDGYTNGYTVTRLHGLCNHKKTAFRGGTGGKSTFLPRKIYFPREGKNYTPLRTPNRLHGLHGYTVTRGYVAFVYFPPEMSTSFYMQNKYIFILHIECPLYQHGGLQKHPRVTV